ncbi:MAG: pyridoxamine 5'-phosphate oxidase [Chitinophagales bacterium]|nr:pyridoxamine 5'-phosphate oxidase [Chitinophagales bacterium]
MRILIEEQLEKHPADQFDKWFHEMLKADFKEPTAVALATSTKSGKPSVRMVLMKEYSKEGFVFYTNYQGRKGKELLENPNAALLFFWDRLERQVRIEGKVKKVSAKESDDYFNIRPRESRIGAIASTQSSVLKNRETLEKKITELTKKYEAHEIIPRPAHWGGFLLKPHYFEFWQGRPSRLHDRIAYKLSGKMWKTYRMFP